MTNEYIFEQHQADLELVRLRLIEEALDHETQDLLRRTGVRVGWNCLELGAGAGSVARWLGQVVGECGQVVALDRNANHLQHLTGPPYAIVPAEFLEVSLGGMFHLAHCRYVLIHNRQSQSMLAKLCGLLEPGGFLVVEEPDFTAAKLLNDKLLNRGTDPGVQRVNNAICRMFEQMQLDPGYGLTLPQNIAAEGLQIRHVDSRIHLHRGGDTMARMMAESTRALRDKYVSTGEASPQDIDTYIQHALDPRSWTVYYATVSVVATRSNDV